MRLLNVYQKTIMLIQSRPYHQKNYQGFFWKTAFSHHECEPGPKCILSNFLKLSILCVSMAPTLSEAPVTHLAYWNVCSWPGLLAPTLGPSPNCSPTSGPRLILWSTYHITPLSCLKFFHVFSLALGPHHGLPRPTRSHPVLAPTSPFPPLQPTNLPYVPWLPRALLHQGSCTSGSFCLTCSPSAPYTAGFSSCSHHLPQFTLSLCLLPS